MQEKKKMGRPLTAGDTRNIRFTIRLADNEHEEIKRKAKEKGMSIADYIRYLVKKDKIK